MSFGGYFSMSCNNSGAYAGSGIVGDDLSAVWYNPAGMVLLPGTQFQMGSVMAYLDLDVETNT